MQETKGECNRGKGMIIGKEIEQRKRKDEKKKMNDRMNNIELERESFVYQNNE